MHVREQQQNERRWSFWICKVSSIDKGCFNYLGFPGPPTSAGQGPFGFDKGLSLVPTSRVIRICIMKKLQKIFMIHGKVFLWILCKLEFAFLPFYALLEHWSVCVFSEYKNCVHNLCSIRNKINFLTLFCTIFESSLAIMGFAVLVLSGTAREIRPIFRSLPSDFWTVSAVLRNPLFDIFLMFSCQ